MNVDDKPYFVSDTGVCLEMQRNDELLIYADDEDAAEACKRHALGGNEYAIACIVKLKADCEKREGQGRKGARHDYLIFGFDDITIPA